MRLTIRHHQYRFSERLRLSLAPLPLGFTLIELLVSMTFLVILMLVVTQVVGIVQRTWVRENSRVSQFREARTAFDVLSRNLSQATLNTYWGNEFDNLGSDSLGQALAKAKSYVRQSELQYISGPTSLLLNAASGNAKSYPGHAVFFQAPLGVTRLVAATSASQANTENMVNLMCGRGYFVEWGDDAPFRPPFLNTLKTVPTRNRLRLMEYSPTAEMNRIYASVVRPITDHSKEWFQDALTKTVQDKETVATRAFTRPLAENILALIFTPHQLKTTGSGTKTDYSIAPQYLYDSTLTNNPGASIDADTPQGTQHLLPPLLSITMIALDQRAAESLSNDEKLRGEILSLTSSLFKNTSDFAQDINGTGNSPGKLQQLLNLKKLNYRIFTTTIALKQAHWSL